MPLFACTHAHARARPELPFVHTFDWQVTAAAGPSNPSAPAAADTGFVVTSGLTAVFAELNLKPEAHGKSLACAAQWLEDIGVRHE